VSRGDGNGYDLDTARAAGWARIYRFEREDRAKEKMVEDPELDARQLAKIAGCSVRHMQQLLADAGVGRAINATGRGRPKRVVRLSELLELRDDYALHRALFGD
jgi:predicted ArsR family transcriptional regulator